MNQQLQTILDIIQQNEKLTNEEKTALQKAVKKADSDLTISEFKLERTEKVKRTTGILLEETIEELEQKRKAVELQNRELEIETALEKVRSRTMAMQHSDELGVVVKFLYQELSSLGLANEQSDVEICIIEEDTGIATIWQTDLNLTGKAHHLTMPFKEFPLLKKEYATWKKTNSSDRKNLFIVNEYSGKKFKQFVQVLSKIDGWEKVIQAFQKNKIENWITNNAYFNHGMLTYQSEQQLSIEGKSFLKRFSAVFEQTYTRFLDLQKAEEQTREAQIEASLERIRSQSMAMRESQELSKIAMTLSNEMRVLGFPGLFQVGYIKWDEEDQLQKGWLTDFEGKNMEPFKLPLGGDKVLNERYRSWKKQTPLLYQKIGSKELYDHVQFCLPTVGSDQVKQQVDKHFSDPTHFYHSFFKEGGLCLISQNALTSSQESLLIRFRKVFEQSYTRFLDIQKAEAQAREVQIEIAMERVRARSMAMHKSEELIDTATLLYKELADLGIPPFSTGFVLVDEKNSKQEVWFSAPGGDGYMERFFLPLTGDSVLDERYRNWKNKEPIYHERVEGERLIEHLKFVSSFFGTREAEEQAQKFPEAIVFYCSYFKEGYLHILTEDILNSEQESIMKRFTQVFAMTYTRFLDLQNAEAQAREAQIEAALEKVRSQSLAMHQSIELQNIVSVVFEQLQVLNFALDGAAFIATKIENFKGLDFWMEDKITQPARFRLPYYDAPSINDIYEASKKNKSFVSKIYGKEKNIWFEYAFEHTNLKIVPEDRKKWILAQSHLTQAFAVEENSMIGIHAHHVKKLSDSEIDILKRFSKVFEQGYIRFLDLQKAEAQAREAQIEVTLERVRARTMGMHRSAELRDVIKLVFDQFLELNLEFSNVGFLLDIHQSNDYNIWMADAFTEFPTKQHIPYFEHTFNKDYVESKEKGEEFFTKTYSFEEKNTWFKAVWKHVLGNSKETEQTILNSPGLTVSRVIMKNTALYSLNFFGKEYSDSENTILTRFAKVFEQTYTRFLDLQKAEAQAKEVLKQSSIDRLRAKIASMRTSKDLEQIIPSIWSELDILGVPFIRCGVFIMNEENQSINTYLSAPNGKALAAFELAYDTNELAKNAVFNWKKKKIYQTSWSKKEFLSFMKDLVDKGLLKNPLSYQGAETPPDYLYLNFAPFKQGMLYAGNTTPLKEDEVEIIQSLANAFSTAYARYEDFYKLEAAKQQVDKALIDLKQTQSQLIQSEKMASLGELTAGIAHEIQNPLNFVNNFSEVSKELLEEMLEEMANGDMEEVKAIMVDLVQNLDKINHHGKRADAIVKGMLQHSRASGDKKEPTDIKALTDEYLRLAYHGLRAKDKSFNAVMETEYDTSIEKIKVVPQDIGRVILNLITNAFYVVNEKKKASVHGEYEPTVGITTKKIDNNIVISVADNGNGIPEHIKDKIFQPFFTTKPTGEGTGLGLSLSYDIVKAHGGQLKMETVSGRGSTFKIILPQS
ncbi:sensor histidine kinase [Seonamhaeicola maritimus]|uniref:sensor histidine kinase n=1 Tax=Seonamhaeicola maritimus TaxID=2591822 RepID=UPI002494D207|nr:ATP-binding protein [Seonamhaeicola maritimus]